MQQPSAPLTRTQQARRLQILEATIAVINTTGYASASIATIAKQAGASKSTVLYHFATKEQLIAAVIGSIYEDSARFMRPHIDAATTLPAKLDSYIMSNIRYIAQHTAQIAAVHKIVSEQPIPEHTDASVRLLQQLFVDGQASGDFGSFDPTLMAVMLRQVIDAASLYILRNPSIDVERYAASICDMFMKATAPGGVHGNSK